MRRKLLVAMAAFHVAFAAQAVPIRWTLNDVTFDDGATASGSFVHDETTSTYSDVLISVSGFVIQENYGSLDDVDPFIYTDSELLQASSDASNLKVGALDTTDVAANCADAACQRSLFLNFLSPLTNAGGTIFLDTNSLSSYEFLSNDFNGAFELHEVQSGFVTGVPVPIPATLWLFGSALGLLGWLKRRSV